MAHHVTHVYYMYILKASCIWCIYMNTCTCRLTWTLHCWRWPFPQHWEVPWWHHSPGQHHDTPLPPPPFLSPTPPAADRTPCVPEPNAQDASAATENRQRRECWVWSGGERGRATQLGRGTTGCWGVPPGGDGGGRELRGRGHWPVGGEALRRPLWSMYSRLESENVYLTTYMYTYKCVNVYDMYKCTWTCSKYTAPSKIRSWRIQWYIHVNVHVKCWIITINECRHVYIHCTILFCYIVFFALCVLHVHVQYSTH